MKTFSIALKSLPQIAFAYEYSMDNYDMEFPPHPNFIEISYLMGGEIFLKRNGTIDQIPENALLISYRTEHERTFARSRQSHLTVGVCIDIEEGDDLLLPNYAIFPNMKKFKDKILYIIRQFTRLRKTNTDLAGNILTLLADVDAEYKKIIQPQDNNYSDILYSEQAKQYIVNHLSERIYVEDIARETGLSVGYLSHIFKKVTKQTLIEYVNITKLQRVKELMETRKLTARKAAELVGYEDENYVSRIYKKYFGSNLSK